MQNRELQMLSDIAVKVGRLEATQEANARAIGEMAASVNRLVEKLDQSDDVAKDALRSTKSAHKRLDKLEKVVYWAGTTIIGAVIVGVVSLLIQGGSSS